MSSVRRGWGAIVALLALACASCGKGERTQLVVLVDSDLAVPSELSSVVATVAGPPDCTDCRTELVLDDAGSIPFSFGIAPRDGDPSRTVRLVLEGRLDGATIVTRRVVTGFVVGETRLVRVRLDRDCVGAPECGEGLTCDAGACVSDEIPAETLPPVVPGEERDAGTPDGEPRSCEGLDGPQTIDPDGPGGAEPFEAWCQSGWTLLLKSVGDARLGFAAEEWEMSGAAPFGGTRPDERENAMLEAYWRLPVDELRIVMTEAAMTPRDVEVPLTGITAAAPLRDLVSAGTASVGGAVADWAGLVGLSFPDPACERRTFSATAPDTSEVVRVRIGVLVSAETDCDPVLGWVGVGASVSDPMNVQCSALATATAGGARLCGMPSARGEHPRFTVVYGRQRPD